MQPLIPVSEQEREEITAGYEQEHSTSSGGGWGALVTLVVLVAALAAAIYFFSTGDGSGQNPAEPAPSEAPVDPGY